MSLDDFLVRWPEFGSLDPDFAAAVLAEAEAQTSNTWGARYDEIVALTTASRLADSPQGRQARLSDPKRNIYQERLNQLRKAHACALNRIG